MNGNNVDRSVYLGSLPRVDRSVYNGGMLTLPPTTAEQPARQRILLTAYTLFYREGIRATGIDRIIAAAGVTKVTFYRHFPSKNALILSFLDYRHQQWLDWFQTALQRHGGTLQALPPTLAEWFHSADFRGCAFINSVGELANTLPEVAAITRRHKHDMTLAIAALLPTPTREADAAAIALAIDGAIIRSQYDGNADAALAALQQILAWYLPPPA